MRQETAYKILRGYGTDLAQAEAISKIFSASGDSPEERERIISEIEDSGIPRVAATTIVNIFLDRDSIT
jgi:hypothetical protein